ncbi:hypothetical protein [Streptomyces adelaidensis]|nr:hypothetical protein [Streptomyces adelaidensis]
MPLLPVEECWREGRRVEPPDWGRWETAHPVRMYVLVALGEGSGHG